MSVKLGSTAIKGLFLGANEIKKMYLGSNLVYQKSGYVDTEFTSCLFPTSWTEVTAGTEYKASNDYGEWKIWADNFFGTSTTYLYLAFDRDNSTGWQSSAHTDPDTLFEIGIDLPLKTLINPTSVYVNGDYIGSTIYPPKIMGYNPLTESWEELGETTRSPDASIAVTNNVFYSKFKLVMSRYSTNRKYNFVTEFQITSGMLRKEN